MYPRETHRRTHRRWHDCLQTATDKVLPSTAPTYRTHIKHKHQQPSPLFSWQTQEVTSADRHMRLSGFTNTYICGSPKYQHDLSVHSAPLPRLQAFLPAPWVLYSLAGPAWCSLANMQHLHTCPAWTLHPPDTSSQVQHLLPAGESSCNCAHPVWRGYRQLPSTLP